MVEVVVDGTDRTASVGAAASERFAVARVGRESEANWVAAGAMEAFMRDATWVGMAARGDSASEMAGMARGRSVGRPRSGPPGNLESILLLRRRRGSICVLTRRLSCSGSGAGRASASGSANPNVR